MIRLFSALALTLWASSAFAQQQTVRPCYGSVSNCVAVTTTTPLPVAAAPGAASASSSNVSTTTSATPGTATLLMAANSARKVVSIKVEGNAVVCFTKYSATPVCGANGTFALKAATASNDGTGGTYTTPPGFTDQEAWYMVSASASVPVFAQWQ